MFSKKQRHQIYKLALEKLENDTHPLIADNIKDATVSIRLVRLPRTFKFSTDHHSVLTLYIVMRS